MENFPDLPTILSVAAAALLTMWIVNRWLFKPLLRIIEERQRRSGEAQLRLEEAQELQTQRLAEIEASLAEARREAYEIRDAAQRAGRERRDALMNEARQEALQMLEAARQEINADFEAARGDLEKEADRLAEMIAERLLGRTLGSSSESER